MRKFVWHSFLFIAPFVVLFGLPFFVFVKAGELVSLNTVIAKQKDATQLVLYGQAYTNSNLDQNYKWSSVAARKPEVVVLGTSRVLGYRAKFFKDGSVFYNAGRGVTNMDDLTKFIQTIQNGAEPKVLLVSLDQIFLFKKFQPDLKYSGGDTALSSFLKYDWRLLYQDYAKHKFTFSDLFVKRPHEIDIGLNALVNSKGFRNDGSFYYGDVISNPALQTEQYTINEASAAAISPDSCLADYYGDHVLEDNLQSLSNFLRLSKERNITVIGYISPYSEHVHNRVMSFKDKCTEAMFDATRQVQSVFAKNGSDFYDFNDISTVGGSDKEMYDNVHFSEKLALRFFIKMAEGSQSLGRYTDIPFLKRRLYNSDNNLEVFHEEF